MTQCIGLVERQRYHVPTFISGMALRVCWNFLVPLIHLCFNIHFLFVFFRRENTLSTLFFWAWRKVLPWLVSNIIFTYSYSLSIVIFQLKILFELVHTLTMYSVHRSVSDSKWVFFQILDLFVNIINFYLQYRVLQWKRICLPIRKMSSRHWWSLPQLFGEQSLSSRISRLIFFLVFHNVFVHFKIFFFYTNLFTSFSIVPGKWPYCKTHEQNTLKKVQWNRKLWNSKGWFECSGLHNQFNLFIY